jgi:CdiI immunity protein
MTGEHSPEKKPFDPADYPALREFLPAYLHEDFADDYGSAAEAVKGFVSEGSGDEILQVREEWKQFRGDFAHHPLQEFQAALGRLGSAWAPANEAELRQIDEILSHAQT